MLIIIFCSFPLQPDINHGTAYRVTSRSIQIQLINDAITS